VNDAKDLAGRIVVLPFKSSKTPASLLNNFGFHLGGSTGTETGALPAFRTSAGQSIFTFASTTADGRRNRIAPAVFIYVKSFGAFAEYARTRQDVAHTLLKRSIANHAWGMTASYVLTGEATSERGVRPTAPFDPAHGKWGALQIAARYGELTLDREIFAAGLATPTSVRTARQASVAANWFPTTYIKFYGTYERFTFEGGSREAENAIIFRTQLAF
jgi:phosphate-selective porin OprO/OprP